MAEAVALLLERQDSAAQDEQQCSPRPRNQQELNSCAAEPPLSIARRRRSSSDYTKLHPASTKGTHAELRSLPRRSDRKAADGVTWDGSRLYWFAEAPPVLQFNPHVRSGYRAGMTPAQCMCSLLAYHNETGNILTHLLPLLGIVIGLLAGWLSVWPGRPLEFAQNLLPIMLCMAGSVTYHTMMANHTRYHTWIMLDVCGIFLLFLGGAHVLLWWGLHCYPSLRLGFTIVYYTTAALAVLASLRASSVFWRAMPMLALFVVRVSVTGTRFALSAGSREATWHYLAMEVYSVVGGVLNTLRAPECWLPVKQGRPGLLDYWLNSHQIMHILVVVAMFHLHVGATRDYRYYVDGPTCSA